MQDQLKIPHILKDVIVHIQQLGGKSYLVGGCVRDALLGITPKDYDVEVHGVTPTELEALLSAQGLTAAQVGKAFGVYKLDNNIDLSLPRRERKVGEHHTAFEVEVDPHMGLHAAAARRDFTINAIYYDINTQEVHDPFNGIQDLRSRILRHVSSRFVEDPLRVLRAMQLAARFELDVHEDTINLCSKLELQGIPKERQYEEWRKLILKGKNPAKGLRFLHACGWIRYYPELQDLVGVKQEPRWHPEGDAWTHTLHCMNAFASNKTGNDDEDEIVGFATLCHDFGKATTTTYDASGWHAYGHEEEGVPLADSFLRSLTTNHNLISQVKPLVRYHMAPNALYKDKAGASAIRRLAQKVRIDLLCRVVTADMQGRPPLNHSSIPSVDWLLGLAKNLNVQSSSIKPLIQGRHLILKGLTPGTNFKAILASALQAQLDGDFTTTEEADLWLTGHIQA